MADVGHLDRDRAPVGTAAQAHRDGEDHGDPEDRRCLGEQLVDVDLVVDQSVDGVGHDHHEGQAGEGEQVDAIGDVPPIGRAQPMLRSGPTKFAQRGTVHPSSAMKVPVCPAIATPADRCTAYWSRCRQNRRSSSSGCWPSPRVSVPSVLVVGLWAGAARQRRGGRSSVERSPMPRPGWRSSSRPRRRSGSLYFSEVAHFVPCRLCWFQRIAMYPLAVILLVAAIRRDRAVRWYAGPLAAIGAARLGVPHLIEWRPELEGGACELFGPSCTDIWFQRVRFRHAGHHGAVSGFSPSSYSSFLRFPGHAPRPEPPVTTSPDKL